MTAFGLNQGSTNNNESSTFIFNQIMNSIPSDSNNPWICATEGNLELLQTLIAQQNLSINEQDSNGFSFLHAAASYNQIPTVRWLLQQKSGINPINVNIQDSDGDTPLHHCDTVDAARVLIEEGNVNFRTKNHEGKNALQVKEEELEDADDSDDSSEIQELKRLIAYLGEVMMSS